MNAEPVLGTARIIVVALVMGSVGFLGIVLFLSIGDAWADPWFGTPLTWVMIATGIGSAVVSFVLDAALRAQAAEESGVTDPQRHVTRVIITSAVIEGGAMANSIAFLLERSPLAIGVAVFLVVLLAAKFPTRASFGLDTEAGDSQR